MPRLLKWGLGAILLGVLGWSGWWYVGARGQEAAVQAWLEQQREQGWQADAAKVVVDGYPLDFRLEATEIALADPATGWSWQAPLLLAASRADTPTRIKMTWPAAQTVAVPGDRAEIRSEVMETVLDLRPGQSMELRQVSGDIRALAIASQSGWKAGAASLDLNIAERSEDLAPPNSYDLRLVGDQIRLPKTIVAAIDPTGWLKPSVDQLTIKGHAAFAEPLDRTTIEQGILALRAATIREAGFEWGDMRLVVKGAVEVDENGFPVGDIRIEAREWRQMVRLAVSSGIIDRNTATSVTRAIQFVSSLTGSGETLSLPLGFGGGKVKIGPFSIADAPRLAPPR